MLDNSRLHQLGNKFKLYMINLHSRNVIGDQCITPSMEEIAGIARAEIEMELAVQTVESRRHEAGG